MHSIAKRITAGFFTPGAFALFFCLVTFAILWRWSFRSFYYPGWEIVGAANGLFILSNNGLWDALKEAFWLSRNFSYWNHTNSVIFSLGAGFLSKLYPWELWAQFTSLVFFLLTLAAIYRAASLKRYHLALLFALLGCSPTILSHAICGYPYISGFLPHVIILITIFDRRIRGRIIPTLILGLFAIELSWHTYELGKTAFMVFFFATVLLRNIRPGIRITWVGLGLFALYLILGNKGINVGGLINTTRDPLAVLDTVFQSLYAILIKHEMDLPILPILGFMSLFFYQEINGFGRPVCYFNGR